MEEQYLRSVVLSVLSAYIVLFYYQIPFALVPFLCSVVQIFGKNECCFFRVEIDGKDSV